MNETSPAFLVVGIGASAGGVDALLAFFAHVPADSGCAFVVILHLASEQDSRLATMLQAVAPIPVVSVSERVRVEPDHVYVVPPNQHLTMADGEIVVSPNTLPETRRAPIDIFFRTLADSHDGRSVCIVLSGSGADGSMGLKRVKERGGAVFVQNPREAAFSEMPRSAIATDLVDDVLPVAEIPARIAAYRDSIGTITPLAAAQRPEEQQALRELFALLHSRTGRDFSDYKRPGLLRRIERRIHVCRQPDLPAYVAFLRDHPDEVRSLLKELLISVTNFFRDPAVFAALEQEIIPRIFQDKRAGDRVRVWVVGCATGEEAYSISMLCAECLRDVHDTPSVQVFASDIDEAALAHARAGLYSSNDVADIPPERLRRFFTAEDARYRVRSELRELVLFANHNILSDPPFAYIDLICCRNLLIYLDRTAQERVIESLHFALKDDGYLVLGSAGPTDGDSGLFTLVSRDHHIYRRRPSPPRPLPLQGPQPRRSAPPGSPPRSPLSGGASPRPSEQINYGSLHQRLLEQYAPPSMVVNRDFAIVHLSEHAGRYLQIAGGELASNVLALIRPELKKELRVALYQALQHQTNVEARSLPLRIDDHSELVNIHVRPVLHHDDPAHGFLLVLFEAGSPPASDAELVTRVDEPAAQRLEGEELQRLKRQLRASSEQYELQAEELRTTNEELQALDEELRVSSEELRTSKEELQSINEELRTFNQELKIKVDEATQTSANLQNLVNSTDIATIFLDRGLRIKLFTPAARALFNLIPADYGRPLSDLTHRLADADVLADAQAVLARLQTIEREVRATDGRVFVMRVLTYRAGEDQISGVVLTFFDISERTRAERALAEQARLLDLSNDAIIVRDVHNRILYWNRGATELYGWTREEAIGQDLHTLLQTEFEAPLDQLIAALHKRDRMEGEVVQVTRDGRRLTALCRWALDRDPQGRPGSILTTYNDITERKRIEEALREGERDFRAIFEGSSVGKAQVDTVTRRFLRVNNALCAITGYSQAELLALTVDEITHPDDRAHDRELFARLVQGKASYQMEKRYVRKDGRLVWVYVTGNVILAADGQTVRTVAMIQDITARKQVEEALRVSEAKYRTLFETMDEGFCILQLIFDAEQRPTDYRYIEINPAFERQTGMHNALGRTIRELVPEIEPLWVDLYGTVALTGEPARLVDHAPSLGRWFDVNAFRIGGPEERKVAVLFNDITERKRREADLAFLSEIGDEFARLSSAEELIQAVGAKIGAYLGVSTCLFADVDEARGELTVSYAWNTTDVPNLRRTFRTTEYLTEEFAQASRAGKMVVVRDTQSDPRTDARAYAALDVHAFVTVPFHRNGVWTYYLGVTDRYPRDWRDDELELIEELSNRIFPRLERARAEAALRESEERFRLMADAVPQIVWLTDGDGRVEFFNKQWSDYTGVPYGPTTMTNVVASFVHPDDAALTLETFEGARRDGGVFAVEHRLRSAAGAYRWFLVRAEPYRDPRTGAILRWFGASVDIHDRKHAEARLQQLYAQEQAARAQAEEASRLKDDFLATVSHELRTPLTAVLGYAQLLQRGRRDEAYVARTVEKMVQGAKAQAALIEDLLDVSRIVSGKLRIEPEPIELLDVVFAALDTVRPTVEAKGLQLEVDLDPAASAVVGDNNRLQQVVWNLLSNAAKFTRPGGRIAVRLAPAEGSVELTVSDTGQGISPDFLPYVFERFRQADSSSQRAHGGLGLGLAIVRHLVELHGGTVEATSAGAGKGATFTVRLPRAEAGTPTGQAGPATPDDAKPDGGQPLLDGLRVLVVDDQLNILELLAELLTSEGATVQSCSTAPEAFALVRTWQPDVLVSDIAMPDADGYWLIRQVRGLAPEEGGATPAVALTAYLRLEDRLRLLAAGFQQYVPKPVDAAELRNVIRGLVPRELER